MKNPSVFRFDGEHPCRLSDIPTAYTGSFHAKEETTDLLEKNKAILSEEQAKLFAQGEFALLIILQGLDAAGKDGVIRNVFSGLNPEGVKVWSFKQPSAEELKHDYLWRTQIHLPQRGEVCIFNRSYYEEVLVVRVHNLLSTQHIPSSLTDNIWEKRYRHIAHYETYLCENGILPVKLFLHLSKSEQKKRLLSRLQNPAKNWKFSTSDVEERAYWEKYQVCYEELINRTASKAAPWHVIPADKKWYARYLISDILADVLKGLHLHYPETTDAQRKVLDNYRKLLETDGSDHQ